MHWIEVHSGDAHKINSFIDYYKSRFPKKYWTCSTIFTSELSAILIFYKRQ